MPAKLKKREAVVVAGVGIIRVDGKSRLRIRERRRVASQAMQRRGPVV
jgi:hypothetical protein